MTPERANADELSTLSSKQLHDQAVDLAKDRNDIAFVWELLRAIPAAVAATGQFDRAEFDLLHGLSLLQELTHAGQGEVANALRPFYIDYLTQHSGS
ncbi:hypothetical protein J4709_11310 [Actinomadura sp. LCR2-06]|uniref:Uncharacterized protein n=1 Tax=Actinomadura violacea TaxID=2819934 RepID=A0ABS3RN28_9ACTN|nr:hypothetical protein [Actinomadura violacea]